MNPTALFRLKGAWQSFTQNHPKFPLFLQAVQNTPMQAGTVIDLKITTPEGKTMQTNVRLTASDLELIASLRDMAQ